MLPLCNPRVLIDFHIDPRIRRSGVFTWRPGAGVGIPPQVTYQGVDLDLGQPFRRATMHDLVREATGVDFAAWTAASDLPAARDAALEALSRADAGPASTAAVQGASAAASPARLISPPSLPPRTHRPTLEEQPLQHGKEMPADGMI